MMQRESIRPSETRDGADSANGGTSGDRYFTQGVVSFGPKGP